MRHARTEGAHLLPSWLEWILTIIAGLAIAFLLRSLVIGVYLVPSGSMLETIHEGDRLVGEKISYRSHAPSKGDVVTFDDPADPRVTLIKRVVATEGQTVDLRDGRLVVDGLAQEEAYTLGKPSYPLQGHAPNLSEDISYPYVVPEGCVWVMGDNRTNSLDSRYFGAVRMSSISSHALFIYWPPTDARAL
ncbi:signal peptidase I [Olsenella urininfantis]|uniref:signal peptidase I n=1 Tax=Olsenella urininfantis TaxID=1871033 RepID=UPI000985342E|nr:signal peptidase I [Olsenella urininfantis]